MTEHTFTLPILKIYIKLKSTCIIRYKYTRKHNSNIHIVLIVFFMEIKTSVFGMDGE